LGKGRGKIGIVINVALGVLYANLFEWVIHKYLLHGLGKVKGSFWSFHYHKHHKRTTKGRGVDRTYLEESFYGKELVALVLLGAIHIPLLWANAVFAITIIVYLLAYYYAHTKAHMDVGWSKKWLPWHYDHHMGYPESNWGVLLPITDIVAGTRKHYLGTQKYYRDELKRGNYLVYEN